jgi:putative flippase GtrA
MQIYKEARRYLTVGAGGFVIDVGLFNLLSVLLGDAAFPFAPIFYKVLSSGIAITFTYLVNSRWTFSERTGREPGPVRAWLYLLVNLIGLVITVTPLYLSRYVFGFESLIADNIAANVVGVGLAFLFRFTMSRKWVFLA